MIVQLRMIVHARIMHSLMQPLQSTTHPAAGEAAAPAPAPPPTSAETLWYAFISSSVMCILESLSSSSATRISRVFSLDLDSSAIVVNLLFSVTVQGQLREPSEETLSGVSFRSPNDQRGEGRHATALTKSESSNICR